MTSVASCTLVSESMASKRQEIATLIRAGHLDDDIAALLECSVRTVDRVRKRIAADESLEDRPRSGRPSKINLSHLRRSIKAHPRRSITAHAATFGVHKSQMSRAVKKLGGKSVVMIERPLLTIAMKHKRLDRCQALLNDLKSRPAGIVNVFEDEKTFTVDPSWNRRNDRVIRLGNDHDIDDVRTITRTKHPASLMLLGVVASNGKVCPPVFFPAGYRLNAAGYQEALRKTVLPWLKKEFPRGNFCYYQDGAPCHTAKATQKFLEDKHVQYTAKEKWPPSSPDVNPLDFSIWARVEGEACRTRHANVKALEHSVAKAWKKLPEEFVANACAAFRKRLEAVVRAEGDYFE